MTQAKKAKQTRSIPLTKDKRKESSPTNGQKGGKPFAPPLLTAAQAILDQDYTDNQSGYQTLVCWRDTWQLFTSHGWGNEAENDVKSKIMTHLQLEEEYGAHATPNYVRSVLDHMKSFNLCGIHGRKEMPMWLNEGEEANNWMAFTNGWAIDVVQLAQGKSASQYKRHVSPNLFSKDYVDYDFDLKAKCPKFMNFLSTSLPSKDSQGILQEMLGLMLTDWTKFEVFFYLYGPTSRNGKTVLLNILMVLVGKQNVSHVALHNLVERFETWPLTESKVNIYGDMATDTGKGLAEQEGIFKDYVSGGMVEYQKKGKDKFNAPCRSRFVFAGNSLPTFVDRSDAIWERLRVIHFPVQIPSSKRDPNLADKIIQKEMSGIFNWAVKGLGRIIKQGRVTTSKEGLEIKDEHRLECDHERMFLKESGYVVGTVKDFVEAPVMFNLYKSWMFRHEHKPKEIGRFYKRVEALFPHVEKIKKRTKIPGSGGKSNSMRVFLGLKHEE